MDLTTCKLYAIKRKRDLKLLLKINRINKINRICNLYKPYIADNGKKRLIEPINSIELKCIQKRIQRLLKDIKYDDNIFSGISGKSYIDNGLYHIGSKYVVALDISKFFPNIGREKVYDFFKNKLMNSSDVAKILTDLCTIDLNKISDLDDNVVLYLKENKIRKMKHIPTGSSISCIMSYLANIDMFSEISNFAKSNGCKVSIYVDDVVISSNNIINNNIINKIISIIKRNGYNIQKKKLKRYYKNDFKRVTGNIISKDGNKLVIPNKIRYRMIKLRNDKKIDIKKRMLKLKGYNQLIQQIEKSDNSHNIDNKLD